MVLLGKPVLFILNHDRVSNGDDAHKGFAILLSKFPLLSRMGGACSPKMGAIGPISILHCRIPSPLSLASEQRYTTSPFTIHNSIATTMLACSMSDRCVTMQSPHVISRQAQISTSLHLLLCLAALGIRASLCSPCFASPVAIAGRLLQQMLQACLPCCWSCARKI